MRRLIFASLILLFPIASFAQSTGPDSRKLYIDANTGLQLADNAFTQTWSALPSLQINIRPPFYSGQIEAGLRYMRFLGDAPTRTNSNFHSFFFYLGWSYPVQVTSRFQIGPTLRFGNTLMIFDEPEIFESDPHRFVTDTAEIEFAYELALRNQYRLSDNWHVHATISYNRTLTEFPIPLSMLSAGVTYSFSSPSWIKKFLQ